MSIHIFTTADEAVGALADFFIEAARKAIAYKGTFNVALSGGSSPKKLYELLAAKYSGSIEWNKASFFFGDERFVPAGHPDSNALMAAQTLFDPLNISNSQVYPVDTSLPPEQAADAYMQTISAHMLNHPVQFDLILLGLGDDAHTASLFPHTEVLEEKEAAVKAVYLQDKKVYRITFTAPLINNAHHIAFLVYGASKENAVKNTIEGKNDARTYPAQLIHPLEGKLSWFLDNSAAAAIKH